MIAIRLLKLKWASDKVS